MSDTTIAADRPIACSLNSGDAKDRFAWIAELNRDALRSYERRGLTLELHYAPEAIERVRELVRREGECCAFLTFGLHDEPNEVRLIITAPEGARDAADALFEQFVASTTAKPACGCAPADTEASARKSGRAGKAVGGVALVSAAGAVAACAVCVVPFTLPAVLLAGTGGALAWLDGAHLWLTALAVVLVATAWLWVWRLSRRSRMRPATSTLVVMSIATGLVTSAVFWPEIEPELVRALTG